ncbi:MAG: ABC transporter ATP-binding protein/permease [Acetobacteraceae bacterium]|nr:ABC transporter ATP-binding protein/permease [Acetobacteraceae bacterium]
MRSRLAAAPDATASAILKVEQERSPARTLITLLPYLWPQGDLVARTRVVAAVILLIAAKLAIVLVPVVYGMAVDALVAQPGMLSGALTVPLALIVGYGLLRAAGAAFGELRDAVIAAVQQRAARKIAFQSFVHMHALSLRFHLDRQTGGLSRAIERGSLGVQLVLRLAVFNVVPTILEVVMVTGVMWWMFDWRFAAIIVFAMVGYLLFTFTCSNWRVKIRRTMNEMDSQAQTRAIDSLLNFETVKYFGNEAHESRRFDEALARYERAAVMSQISLNMLNLGQATIIALGLAVIMLLAAGEVAAGTMTVGAFVLANTYLIQLYQPLNMLGVVYREIRQGLVDMEALFHLLDINAEITDRPDAVVLPTHLKDRAAGEVVFEDVHFDYRPDRKILKGVSFRVPPGGKLAIVGPTGAGKSTISRLLFRFYDVTTGAVRIDGQDIRGVTQESLRTTIGVVPQDTVLFNDTIRYNIAYGRPGATQDEVETAAKLAQVHDFVLRLPEGYDTRVGERGLKLSGGEKQRVAIARTILKDPRILILDEATSALDTSTEQDIQTALRSLASHRTTVVIAHRLSTVVDADEIIVLQDGQVAERGTHAWLLARDGLYAHMWALQAEQTASADIAAD